MAWKDNIHSIRSNTIYRMTDVPYIIYKLVSCPDPMYVGARGSDYTSPNSWARFRI